MPRPLRIVVPGAVYHITARGNRRQPIYADERDRERFFELLSGVVSRRGWRCHAYCLMPNHYHLVVETPGDLSPGMRELNGRYAQWFNGRHAFTGHLFQGRFHAAIVESDWHAIELSRYVVLNPVRAGLAARPGTWRWSSYRPAVGDAAKPAFLTTAWLLGFFGKDPRAARDAYRRFARDGPGP